MNTKIQKSVKILVCVWLRYLKLFCKISYTSLRNTIKKDGIEHAGYLAFLTILSIFPFLIFLVMTVGFLGQSSIGREFIELFLQLVPKQASQALLPRIEEIISGPPQNFLTLAIVGVIWTASSLVEGLRTILNRSYRVYAPPPYIFRRLWSVLEFFIIAIYIAVGMLFLVLTPLIIRAVENYLHISLNISYGLFNLRYFLIITLLFLTASLLYFAIPNIKQPYKRTIPGAILTITLWVLIKNLFILYLGNFNQFNFVYGSLAGIMIFLIFFYLVNLALILGAEFNYNFNRVFFRSWKG